MVTNDEMKKVKQSSLYIALILFIIASGFSISMAILNPGLWIHVMFIIPIAAIFAFIAYIFIPMAYEIESLNGAN